MKKLIIITIIAVFAISGHGQLTPVNVGSGPNSGTGDPLRTAFQKLNHNDLLFVLKADSASYPGYKTLSGFKKDTAKTNNTGSVTYWRWNYWNNKQAAISNLSDTSKYMEYGDTTGTSPKIASGQDVRDTAKNIRTTVNLKLNKSDTTSLSNRINTKISEADVRYIVKWRDSINIIIGEGAGYRNLGDYVTVIGWSAGYTNQGDYQTAIGYQAGLIQTGIYQTAVGFDAGIFNQGDYQTALGMSAGWDNTGNNQIAIGDSAGWNNTGDNVIMIGDSAGKDNTHNYRLFIGTKDADDSTKVLLYGNEENTNNKKLYLNANIITKNIEADTAKLKTIDFDSTQDTTVTAIKGRMIFKSSDSTVYVCRSIVAAKKWYAIY